MVLREGFNTQQLMVNLSLASQNTNQEQSKIRETLQQTMRTDPFLQQEINTLVLTENTGLADTVKNPDSKTQILRGKGYIEEQLNFQDWDKKVSYRISPFSFFQTNTHGAEQLFATAFTML